MLSLLRLSLKQKISILSFPVLPCTYLGCNFSWGEKCDALHNTFEFRLYMRSSNQAQWNDSYVRDEKIMGGGDRTATTKFEGLNVFHEYQCGVRVEVSSGIYTDANFSSSNTKMPKEIKTTPAS